MEQKQKEEIKAIKLKLDKISQRQIISIPNLSFSQDVFGQVLGNLYQYSISDRFKNQILTEKQQSSELLKCVNLIYKKDSFYTTEQVKTDFKPIQNVMTKKIF